MCTRHTAPAEAHAPDPDRAGPDAPAPVPERLLQLLILLIDFLLQHVPALRRRHLARLPSWWVDVPEYQPGSTQALAASVRGAFGNAIARMCRQRGIGPGHPEWPYLSRTIVAFGGSLAGFQAGAPPSPREWWESHRILPAVVAAPLPAPSPLSRLPAEDSLAPAAGFLSPSAATVPAEAGHAPLPASWLRPLARAGTGPPIGPPAH